MIKAVIFDLDGTILNTITTITYFVNQTLQKYDILPIAESECKTFIGDGARKLIERSLASKGVFDKAIIEEILPLYNLSYDENPFYLTERYEGVEPLLHKLKEKEIKLGVISNKPHPTTISAIAHFYPDLFDLVVGGREGVPLKPAAAAGEAMLTELGVFADEIIYVGDSGVDMTFGKAIGAAYTLGAGWGFRGKEELISAGSDHVFMDATSMKQFILDVIK